MFEKKESLAQKVGDMRKKGLSDNQILQSLQQEGHTSKEVLDAFEIADHANTIQNLRQRSDDISNYTKFTTSRTRLRTPDEKAQLDR